MADPVLKRGAKSKQVEELQTLLNRTGAMLKKVDGDFGGGTETAVKYAQKLAGQSPTGIADAALWTWLRARGEPYPLLPGNCVAYIAAEETGGLQYYEKFTRYPHWPGEKSGITIGVGYDLKMNNREDFMATWGALLPPATITELLKDIQKPGSEARKNELKAFGIEVPFSTAWQVFVGTSMPVFHGTTRTAFRSLDTLPVWCRTVLISLVYNRGSSTEGPARTEMLAIQNILKQAALAPTKDGQKALLADVEKQLLLMRRIWPDTQSLRERREREAEHWREALATW